MVGGGGGGGGEHLTCFDVHRKSLLFNLCEKIVSVCLYMYSLYDQLSFSQINYMMESKILLNKKRLI